MTVHRSNAVMKELSRAFTAALLSALSPSHQYEVQFPVKFGRDSNRATYYYYYQLEGGKNKKAVGPYLKVISGYAKDCTYCVELLSLLDDSSGSRK